MPKSKTSVVFIGQSLYFSPHVPAELPGCDVKFIEYRGGVTQPETLAGLSADVIFFFRGELIPPAVLETMTGRKVLLSTEPVPMRGPDGEILTSTDRAERMGALVRAAGRFDLYYHYDRTSLSYLAGSGFEGIREFVLPVRLDALSVGKRKAFGWACLLIGKETSYRAWMTNPLKHRIQGRFCHAAHGFDIPEMVRLAGRSESALNVHVDDLPTIEPRLQLYMAMGLPVFSEVLSHDGLFKPNTHFVPVYGPDDLEGKVVGMVGGAELSQIAGNADALVRERLDARKVWPALIEEVLA